MFMEEITPKLHRDLVGNLYWIYWCLGYAGAAAIGYMHPNWKIIQLLSTVVCAFYVGVFVFMPESPR